jgi:hypothetical protein
MSRIHNLLYWLGKADEEKVAKTAERIVDTNPNTVVDSQGVHVTVGLGQWPVYARRRKGCRYWSEGINDI